MPGTWHPRTRKRLHKQPEQAKFYKLKDDTPFIEVLERSELEQEVDLNELFKR